MAEVIGLMASMLGIISFTEGQFAKLIKPGPETVVRIQVGLDYAGGLSNAGGDIPDVRIFNEAGTSLGKYAYRGHIHNNEFRDIIIQHKHRSNQAATYALFSAHNDAICIAYATVTAPSGDKYGWVGDWGRKCGGNWYYSHVPISGTNYQPDCFWIDGNGDQPQTGFQIHWPEFSNRSYNDIPPTPAAQEKKIDYLCTAGPPFKMHSQPNRKPKSIVYWNLAGNDTRNSLTLPAIATSYAPLERTESDLPDPRRRRQRKGPSVAHMISTSLVVDDNDQHSAGGLCNDANSYGPDFLDNARSVFCRMSDKKVFPVCGSGGTDEIVDNCFHRDLQQLILNGVAARDEPYRKVIDWTLPPKLE
ncbi:hypothetical protein F5Y19DRAFT_493694 [Xylariaceae sp. FL1651]|nr:hypothetical protein F5Y19DRAFT_493694 [Xylariaceae sp. FL1651]